MKDSGIPWIGEIPEHWEVKRLKFLASIQGGVTKGRDLEGKNIIELPYLRVANVQDGYIDLTDVASIQILATEEERYSLRAGDILMNEGGDNDKLGRGVVWEGQIPRCLHQNHVFAVRVTGDNNPYWINLATRSKYLKSFFLTRAKQSTNLASISSSNLKEAPIVVPPTNEQPALVKEIKARLDKIEGALSKISFQIQKLQEYRQSLITAAVTGKLEVGERQKAEGRKGRN